MSDSVLSLSLSLFLFHLNRHNISMCVCECTAANANHFVLTNINIGKRYRHCLENSLYTDTHTHTAYYFAYVLTLSFSVKLSIWTGTSSNFKIAALLEMTSNQHAVYLARCSSSSPPFHSFSCEFYFYFTFHYKFKRTSHLNGQFKLNAFAVAAVVKTKRKTMNSN